MDLFTFNPIKHHAGHIRAFIELATWDEWRESIKLVGNSMMDLYNGTLTVQSVKDEIVGNLKQRDVFEREKFFRWLNGHREYQVVELSDNSVWILRKGENEKYIHVHPGRHSPHSIRITANILKTVITCGFCLKDGTIPDISLESVNHVRSNILDLSRIRISKRSQGLTKAFHALLGSRLQDIKV
jgi:hypothetical protein